MKFSILCLITAAIISSCGLTKLSSDGINEKEFTSCFIDLMKAENSPDYRKMMDYIAPSYIKANNIINIENCKVNNYNVHEYNMICWDQPSGIITYHIWGKDKLWTHEVSFKIVIENKKLWLMPSKHEDNWIDAWHKVKTFI